MVCCTQMFIQNSWKRNTVSEIQICGSPWYGITITQSGSFDGIHGKLMLEMAWFVGAWATLCRLGALRGMDL